MKKYVNGEYIDMTAAEITAMQDAAARAEAAEKRRPLLESLALDPRPAYLEDKDCPYGFAYAGFDVRFYVKDGLLTVFDILPE